MKQGAALGVIAVLLAAGCSAGGGGDYAEQLAAELSLLGADFTSVTDEGRGVVAVETDLYPDEESEQWAEGICGMVAAAVNGGAVEGLRDARVRGANGSTLSVCTLPAAPAGAQASPAPAPTRTPLATRTATPSPSPTAEQPTPTSDPTETVQMFMLRNAAPSLEGASDETIAALAQGVCDAFADNPGADVGQFVAGMASAGVSLEEASDFVAASFVLLCPDLAPATG